MAGGGDNDGRHRHHWPPEMFRAPGPGAPESGREDPGQEVFPPLLRPGLRHSAAEESTPTNHHEVPAVS